MNKVFLLAATVLVLGSVSSAQAADTQRTPDELFKRLDVNGDGKLTASEIPPEHRKFFERLLRIGDADKNGELSREEFDRAFRQTEETVTDIDKVSVGGGAPARPNIDPKRVFQALDKNKDGKLTREEAEGRPRILALFDRLNKEELTVDDLTTALRGAKKPNGKKGKKLAKKQAAKTSETNEAMEATEAGTGASLPAIFRMLDTDGDGRLSAEELSKAGDLFKRLDRNQDGFIDAKEFSSPAASGVRAEASAPAGGSVTRVAKFHNGSHLMRLLMQADANGDGKLSMEEAPPQIKKHFARIDTNGDGFIDRGEIEAWIKHRQKRMGAAATTAPNTTAVDPTQKPSGL